MHHPLIESVFTGRNEAFESVWTFDESLNRLAALLRYSIADESKQVIVGSVCAEEIYLTTTYRNLPKRAAVRFTGTLTRKAEGALLTGKFSLPFLYRLQVAPFAAFAVLLLIAGPLITIGLLVNLSATTVAVSWVPGFITLYVASRFMTMTESEVNMLSQSIHGALTESTPNVVQRGPAT